MRHSVLLVAFLVVSVLTRAQEGAGSGLNQFGEELMLAFKKQDASMILDCFFTKDEVEQLLTGVAAENGDTGVLAFSVDSMHMIFQNELIIAYDSVSKMGSEEGVKWKKIKFEEVGLADVVSVGGFKTATIVLVIRLKKDQFYMIQFPESYNLGEGWSVGPYVRWTGRVTK